MRLNKIYYLFLVLIFSNSCSSVKLVDSYFIKDDISLKSKKILVIARSEDLEVRKSYENKLVEEISKRGFDVVPAHLAFPDLKEKRNRSEEEIQEIVNKFKEKGIKSILLTSLRRTTTIKQETENKQEYTRSQIEKGKYGVSFVDYYNVNSVEFLSSSLRPRPLDSETKEDESFLKSTIYSLEAIIYDLTLTDESQLLGIYEIDATDPKSAQQVLNKFTSIVAKQLN